MYFLKISNLSDLEKISRKVEAIGILISFYVPQLQTSFSLYHKKLENK